MNSQAPAEGTYHVADANGLIWSLAPEGVWDNYGNETRFIDSELRDYRVAFTLTRRRRAIAKTDIVRQPLAPGGIRQAERKAGPVATLFLPPGRGPTRRSSRFPPGPGEAPPFRSFLDRPSNRTSLPAGEASPRFPIFFGPSRTTD